MELCVVPGSPVNSHTPLFLSCQVKSESQSRSQMMSYSIQDVLPTCAGFLRRHPGPDDTEARGSANLPRSDSRRPSSFSETLVCAGLGRAEEERGAGRKKQEEAGA
ncbi:hypothetical protein DPEC_G00308840 [Dallia pectoralis]|uniref:Uncharacterized protein n=1 Tax=Dallia pectoralis TaxID=75939 RepID=A0ACC2FEM9_DALPE|nr:hypothetical protein DPEC_G00308840 [Dallia pectoralis]